MSEKNSLLNQRCSDSKGSSAQHLYIKIEKILKTRLDNDAKILDLGSGVGNFKNFLMLKSNYKIVEVDYAFAENREVFHQVNLNEDFNLKSEFEAVTIIEVLHFMENPRHLLRQAKLHLADTGYLVIGVPNLHSLTSLLSFVFRGVHSAFSGKNYPAHITPLHKIDILRMLSELQIKDIKTFSSQLGRIPGSKYYWQRLFTGCQYIFTHQLFSDNLIFIAKKY